MEPAPLTGQVALVTGSGRGIGRATALRLAAAGASLIVTARTTAEVAATCDQIAATGGQAWGLAGDLTEPGWIDGLFDQLTARYGRLDILVNNAGAAPFGPVETFAPERLEQVLALNITAVFQATQRAIGLMREHGDVGKIVTVGSVRSRWTEGGDAGAYNASKAGVRAMVESIARQLHGTGSRIAVSIVCPGVVDTALTNPTGAERPTWLRPETVAEAIYHQVTAPPEVNVFEITLFGMSQKPW